MKRTFPLLLLILALTASAEDLYVATNGGDSNPGTQAQPWRTIQRAANTGRSRERPCMSQPEVTRRRRSALATAAPQDQDNNESVHSNEVPVVIHEQNVGASPNVHPP